MNGKYWWKGLLSIALILVLLVPLLAACDDDDDDDDDISTSAASLEPVKIGAICSWSGPAAMAGSLANQVLSVVEDQVEAQGGIMGRPLEIITFDDEGQAATAVAGVTKLAKQDKVDAIVWGGGYAPTLVASVEAAEDIGVPLFTFSSSPADISDLKWVTRAGYVTAATIQQVVGEFIVNKLAPQTVCFISADDMTNRERVDSLKEQLESAGIDVVCEEFPPVDTADMSSYLTKIRSKSPDVLVGIFNAQESYTTLFKQIMEQGGWGDMTFVSGSGASSGNSIVALPGAEGTYHFALWVPGLDTPGSKEFEDAFFAKHGKTPQPPHVFFYISLWTAIKALEATGTTGDYDALIKVARSGDLSWDSPSGVIEFGQDGEMMGAGQMFEVIDGTLTGIQ